MIRISISQAAFQAIAALPFGSAVFERDADAKGEQQIWLARAVVDRLAAMRGPDESYSDVILRLAKP
ncbi:MAG TPA: hypothetical protein VF886_00605 [Roseiarcus sp.]